ncbi:hypothetical protein MTR_4g039780 [Medicago truncatula]|uniref:Uncharacterized protein n=1 Tax=Medicago truncatula TaxID=3880 RepID=G7JUL8_MEDTR|nr:hypothetical protein MTR_4g039780 [Medicago truncatula]
MSFLKNINGVLRNLTVKKVEQQPSSSVNKEDFVLLESSSSPAHEKTTMRRTRTKRPHLATFSPPRSTMQPISPIFSFVEENMQNNIISNKAVSSAVSSDSQIGAKK